MDALDLHVKQRLWIDAQSQAFVDETAEGDLVGALYCAEALLQRGIVSVVGEPNHGGLIIHHGSPADFAQELGQPGIGMYEPAAKCDAIRLIDDAVGIKAVELTESRPSHQLSVERGDAIDAVRAHEREMAHSHPLAVPLIDQRDRGEHVGRLAKPYSRKLQVLLVDAINNLQMSRQHAC